MQDKIFEKSVKDFSRQTDEMLLKDIITIYISSFSYKFYRNSILEYNNLVREKNKFKPGDDSLTVEFFYERPMLTKKQFDFIRSLKGEK